MIFFSLVFVSISNIRNFACFVIVNTIIIVIIRVDFKAVDGKILLLFE